MSSADDPVQGLKASVAQSAVDVFGTILVGLTDEIDQPLGVYDPVANLTGVLIRHVYGDEDVHYPSILVSVQWGAMTAGMGYDVVDEDPDTYIPTYGRWARRSTITLTVRDVSDAGRTYLADVLAGAILDGYWVNPATGLPVDEVVRIWLAERGIQFTGLGAIGYPPPELDAARPDGQIYTATIPVQCDIWVTSTGSVGPTIGGATLDLYVTDDTQTDLPSNPTSIPAAF